MARMLTAAQKRLQDQAGWITGQRTRISSSLARLDRDFDRLRAKP